ncbi:MAG: hypothetical protein WBZ19_00415, partial [Chthoniobacterales bacterium]
MNAQKALPKTPANGHELTRRQTDQVQPQINADVRRFRLKVEDCRGAKQRCWAPHSFRFVLADGTTSKRNLRNLRIISLICGSLSLAFGVPGLPNVASRSLNDGTESGAVQR